MSGGFHYLCAGWAVSLFALGVGQISNRFAGGHYGGTAGRTELDAILLRGGSSPKKREPHGETWCLSVPSVAGWSMFGDHRIPTKANDVSGGINESNAGAAL